MTNKTITAILECETFFNGCSEVEETVTRGGAQGLQLRLDMAKRVRSFPVTLPVKFDDESTGEVVVSGMGAGYSVGRKQYANLYFSPKTPAAPKPVAEYTEESDLPFVPRADRFE
jgi:hypothetical protein